MKTDEVASREARAANVGATLDVKGQALHPAAPQEAHGGMTLIELLVAFSIFVLIIGALVGLADTSLSTWTQGEDRKDAYDRAQIVLDQIREDLRNTFSENVTYTDGRKVLQPAAFLCDGDANGAARLRFVRGGDMEKIRVAPPARIPTTTPTQYYGDLWEVGFLMDSDPSKGILYRAVRYFDRRSEGTLLAARDVRRTDGPFVRRHAETLETGVLYLGFRFWTSETRTWAPAGSTYFTCRSLGHRSLVQQAGPGKCPICGRALGEKRVSRREGADLIWDSTRSQIELFRYHRNRQDRTSPDFVYPEIVQVTLVMESQASEIKGLQLRADAKEDDLVFRVTSTAGLPDPPGYVKIDAEWVEYEAISYDEIRVRRRAVRGGRAAAHKTGTTVRFGETFVTEVRVPAYRPAVLR